MPKPGFGKKGRSTKPSFYKKLYQGQLKENSQLRVTVQDLRDKVEELELQLAASREAHKATKQAYEIRGRALSEGQAFRMKLAKELSKYVGEATA